MLAWLVPSTVTVLLALAAVIFQLGGLTTKVGTIDKRVERIENAQDAQEKRAQRRGEWPVAPPSEQS